jgi:F-type H+-transporting ATPase subunit b
MLISRDTHPDWKVNCSNKGKGNSPDWTAKRMSDLLSQLGNLLLHAVPTAVLFAILWFAYRQILDKKLVAVLAERRERTQGAMEKARADISAAEARSAEYERRIREAKAAMYAAQQARRQRKLEEKAAAVTEARKAAQARAEATREALNTELTRAKAALQPKLDALVDQIMRVVLKQAPVAASTSARGMD